MDIKNIDLSFQDIFVKDSYGNIIHPGDFIINKTNYEIIKANDMLFRHDHYYNSLLLIEYFISNNKIIPFMHSHVGVCYKIAPFNIDFLDSFIKISSDELSKFKYYQYCDEGIINFKNSIYYKTIYKIQRGIFYRNGWIKKYGTFPIIETKVNGNVINMFKNSKLNFYLLDDFYNYNYINKSDRNFEIYCKKPYDERHVEYFFNFKKENK